MTAGLDRVQLQLTAVRARKVFGLVRTPGYWRTARAGVVPSVEHRHVPFDRATATVFDIGAHRGQFAAFALHSFPRAKIVCFEPLEPARQSLQALFGKQVEIRPFAVGRLPGEAQMNVSARDDSSSLLPIGERQTAAFPGTDRAASATVEVVTLADADVAATPGPRLLKIDVQGFELAALQGAAEALDLFDQVFVECSFQELYEGQPLADEVIAFLLGRGLRLVGVFGLLVDTRGVALQADLLFNRG